MKSTSVRYSIGLFVAALLGALGGYWLHGFVQQDRCLDRGGRWNASLGSCEFTAKP